MDVVASGRSLCGLEALRRTPEEEAVLKHRFGRWATAICWRCGRCGIAADGPRIVRVGPRANARPLQDRM